MPFGSILPLVSSARPLLTVPFPLVVKSRYAVLPDHIGIDLVHFIRRFNLHEVLQINGVLTALIHRHQFLHVLEANCDGAVACSVWRIQINQPFENVHLEHKCTALLQFDFGVGRWKFIDGLHILVQFKIQATLQLPALPR